MRIAQILTELGPGGAERVVLDLCKALLKAGHSPFVVSLAPPPSNPAMPEAFEAAGIEVRYAGVVKRAPWTLLRLARVLSETKPELVHSHLMHPNLAARLLKPFYGKPLVNSVHIADRRPFMKPWFLLDRATFGLCDACNAVSKAAARFHEAALGLPQGSIAVVYNGIEKAAPASQTTLSSLRAEWRLEGFSKILGSVGRLAPQKGYDILLGMLPELSKAIPQGEKWALLIIGEGPERERLEKLAAAAPENIAVRLPGFRSDAASLMALFDAFVMPSRYEGYGLTLAEAMSLGLPVVANDIDSLPELCSLYENARCVEFPSSEAVAAIVQAVAAKRGDPFEPMSLDAMAQAYLNLYEKALRRR